ncbi:MAG: HNH endonuclease [Thermodesulfobacteriota bacterium]
MGRADRTGQRHRRSADATWSSPEELRKERQRARELRQTPWWRRKLARGICYYCGRRFPPRELTMDHVVPLVRGGRSSRSNCVTSCKECNTKKRTLLPLEWDEYLRGRREEGDPDP